MKIKRSWAAFMTAAAYSLSCLGVLLLGLSILLVDALPLHLSVIRLRLGVFNLRSILGLLGLGGARDERRRDSRRDRERDRRPRR